MNWSDPCPECESEALVRILAVRDALDAILWGEIPPMTGVEAAAKGLAGARRCLLAAGFEAGP